MAADLRGLYRRWLLELWHGELPVAAELVTDDFVVHQAHDGRFCEHWVSSDGLQLMAQLGALGPGA
jgi:hypothetical protein